jgi:hypothetical protein
MAYLGKTPSQATRKRYYKTASGSETSISGTMTVGGTLTFTDGEFVDVSVNGVALVAGTDYNTTTANTIGGLSALTANDQVEIVVYDTFSVFGGNVNGDFTVSNGTLTAGTVDINGGAVDGTAIGAASASTGAFTTVSASSNVDFNGDLDVDGTTNLDAVDIDGAVDMASTLQVDGAITSSAGATITTADNDPQLTLVSTDADGNPGPVLKLRRNSSSVADEDVIGKILFHGQDGAGNDQEYVNIQTRIKNNAQGNEDGQLDITSMSSGTGRSRVFIRPTETVFNDDGQNLDFRVESDNHTNMLFVDAANDVFGVGAASPDTTFRTSIHGDGSSIIGGILFRNNPSGGETFTIGHVNATSSSAHINVVPSANLIFSTNNTQRARITASGHLLLGRDTETTNATLSILSDTTDRIVQTTSTGTDTQHHFFFANNSGTGVGTITCTTSGTSFVTSSDYRLKENVDYTWDATTRLKQLKPARFNFIADDTNTLVDGFLAHEVSSIVPEAINGTKDETRSVSNAVLSSTGELLAEGITQDEWTAGKDDTYPSDSTWTSSHTEPVMQGIDQSKLVPLLVKTIQELEARIATLEAG